MMSSDQQVMMMRLNVLFMNQTQRQMQTTIAIQISKIDQLRDPYQTKMKSNIFFQAQAKRVTKKQVLK